MEKNKKIVRIKFSDEELKALDYVLNLRLVKSPHLLIRILILEEYKKEKNKNLLYGSSPYAEQKRMIGERIDEMRAMTDEELTKHLYTLGYEEFSDEYFDNELALVDRLIKFDKIVTNPETKERCWITEGYIEGDKDRKIVYHYDTFLNVEKIFKDLLKLKLIK